MSDSQSQVRTRKGIGFLLPASKWILKKLNCLNIAAHLPHQSGFIDAYVLANFSILAAAGLMLSLNPAIHWGWILTAVILAVYTVFTLVITHLAILLTGGWRGERTFVNYRRTVLLAMLNYLELLLASAVILFALDKWLADAFNERLGEFCNAWYLAVITLTTTGFGDFYPTHPFAKCVTSALLLFSVLILSQIIARFISLAKADPEEYPD